MGKYRHKNKYTLLGTSDSLFGGSIRHNKQCPNIDDRLPFGVSIDTATRNDLVRTSGSILGVAQAQMKE